MLGKDFELEFIDIPSMDALEARLGDDAPPSGPRSPVLWLKFNGAANAPKHEKTKTVRALPPWTSEGRNANTPYAKHSVHWNVGPEKTKVSCPYVMTAKEQSCAVCEYRKELFAEGSDESKELAMDISPRTRFIWQVIDRADPIWLEGDEQIEDFPELVGKPKIQFMGLPFDGHRQIIDAMVSANYGNITNPLKGNDITVSRSGERFKTKYSCTMGRETTPLFVIPGTEEEYDGPVSGKPDKEKIREALELMYNLDEHPFLKMASYDETKAALTGVSPEGDKKQFSGGSTSAKMGLLSIGKKEEDDPILNDWMKMGDDYKPVEFDNISEWAESTHGVEISPEDLSPYTECYGTAPDHKNKNCQTCDLNGICVATYNNKIGAYSTSQPNPKKDKKSFSMGSKPKKSSSAEAEDMLSMLENASK